MVEFVLVLNFVGQAAEGVSFEWVVALAVGRSRHPKRVRAASVEASLPQNDDSWVNSWVNSWVEAGCPPASYSLSGAMEVCSEMSCPLTRAFCRLE